MIEECNVTLNICTERPEKIKNKSQPVSGNVSASGETSHALSKRRPSQLQKPVSGPDGHSYHSNVSDSDDGDNRIRRRLSTGKCNKKQRQQQQQRQRATTASHQKSSSLFSCNPEVVAPSVDLQQEQQQQQQQHLSLAVDSKHSSIFSSDTFTDIDIHPHLATNVTRQLQHSQMTVVQQRAIPRLLQGHDCLIRAPTGSGKTLCYALPVVHSLQAIDPPVDRSSGVLCLVILPTHELAQQTLRCFQALTKAFVRLVSGCVCGGESVRAEKRLLRRGCSLLLATPGRLLHHLQQTAALPAALARLRWLVIDEADLLLDMGYHEHVTRILETIQSNLDSGTASRRLQTVLLSATLDRRVQQLAGVSLREPVNVSVGEHVTSDRGDAAAAAAAAASGGSTQLACPAQLQHWTTVVPAKLRLVTLVGFVLHRVKSGSGKLVVFMATGDMVDYHAPLLAHCLQSHLALAVKVFRLHGAMSREDRVGMLSDFRNNNPAVLICTDVAARGLDVPCVDWIVQYTPPSRAEDYIHRAGRTARAGRAGSALLFLTPAETAFSDTLHSLGIKAREMSLETILAQLALHSTDTSSVEAAATQLQLAAERAVAEDPELQQLAFRAYSSLLRAYASYPAVTRRVFCVARLHLGHYAKSLALRHTPSQIAATRSGSGPHHHHHQHHHQQQQQEQSVQNNANYRKRKRQ